MGVLLTVATILAAAAIGIAAERRRPEPTARLARRGLSFGVYVILPIVTFFNIARLDLDVDVGVGLALGLAATASGGVLAYLVGSRLFRLSRPQTGALIVVAILANSGFLGYPLSAALLGFDSLSEIVAYDALVSGTSLLLGAFAVGATFGTQVGPTATDRIRAYLFRNPPLIAAIAALLAPDALAPDVLVDSSRVLVIALLPLGFFIVGATLSRTQKEAGGVALRPNPPGAPVIAGIAIRMAFIPGLLLIASLPLIDLPDPYLLGAAMPCGINCLLVAHLYGLDLRMTAEAVAWSTALAITGVLTWLGLGAIL